MKSKDLNVQKYSTNDKTNKQILCWNKEICFIEQN